MRLSGAANIKLNKYHEGKSPVDDGCLLVNFEWHNSHTFFIF